MISKVHKIKEFPDEIKDFFLIWMSHKIKMKEVPKTLKGISK